MQLLQHTKTFVVLNAIVSSFSNFVFLQVRGKTGAGFGDWSVTLTNRTAEGGELVIV